MKQTSLMKYLLALLLIFTGALSTTAVTVESITFRDGTTDISQNYVVEPSYKQLSFTLNFSDAIVANNVYGIKMYENAISGEGIDLEGMWLSSQNGSNSIHVWCEDNYGDGVVYFSFQAGKTYYIVMPEGTFKSGGANVGEIILELRCEEPAAIEVVSTTPADGQTIVPGEFSSTLQLTFGEAVNVASLENIKVTKNTKWGSVVVNSTGWNATMSNNNKTYTLSNTTAPTFNAEDATSYLFIVPSGTFKNTAGSIAGEIVVTVNCVAPPAIKLTESTPADGSTVVPGAVSAEWLLTFNEGISSVDLSQVKFHEGTKDGALVAGVSNNWKYTFTDDDHQSLKIWSEATAGATDAYTAVDGTYYVLVIPAGAVTSTSGLISDEIVITIKGETPPPFNPTSIEPAQDGVVNHFSKGYLMPALWLTFPSSIFLVDDAPAIEFRKNAEDGEIVPTPSWHKGIDEETPNQVLIQPLGESGIEMWVLEEPIPYYFIIPQGVFRNADGGVNDRLVVRQYGTKEAAGLLLTPTNAEMEITSGKFVSMKVVVDFDEAVQAGEHLQDITIHEGSETGEKIELTGEWRANFENGNKRILIWVDEYDDGYVGSFVGEYGKTYYTVIPEGAIATSYGATNDPFVVSITVPTEEETGISNASGNNVATEFYSISGSRSGKAQKGVNVIRFSDGTTQKVIIK
ncbi:MAG: Ig-like domain-containing protein [Prevotella sp.]|nr:Ig-like domain-containing protein [Prevotella sp.]